MMLGTLFFSIEYSRREAQKTMDRNIGDLKKQINDYNEFLAAEHQYCMMIKKMQEYFLDHLDLELEFLDE